MICPNCGKENKRNKLNRCHFCNKELADKALGLVYKEEEYHQLYRDGNIRIEATLSKEKYKVTFNSVMITDWIRCPSCHAKLFLNQMLKGKLQQKCRRCKIIIDYEFK